MKIAEYIRILHRRGWIILLAIVAAAASAFLFSKLQTSVYRASVEVSIQLARPDLSLTQSTKQLLRSYANVMWSEKRAEMVIQQLGLYMSPADLKGDATIVADDSLMVIKIDVDNPDGELAKSIANTWAQILVDWRTEENAKQDKQDRVFAEIIDPAVRYRLLRPKLPVNIAAGAFLGLTVGVVVVFVLEWLEAGVIVQPRDLEQETGLAVIGLIPPVSSSK